jgi:hypothetical protein
MVAGMMTWAGRACRGVDVDVDVGAGLAGWSRSGEVERRWRVESSGRPGTRGVREGLVRRGQGGWSHSQGVMCGCESQLANDDLRTIDVAMLL